MYKRPHISKANYNVQNKRDPFLPILEIGVSFALENTVTYYFETLKIL